MKTKTALYARTSTVSQNTDNQLIVLKEYALSHGLSFDIYEEKESTRKTRPVKQELLRKIRAGFYNKVVIVRLDRWARSSTELLLEIEEITKKGVDFISLNDHLDFNTASGKLHLAILSAFSSFERNLLSERTKVGIMRAKLEGKKLGRPFGSKDARPRKKSGYIMRAATNKKQVDESIGVYLPIESYLSK